MQPFVYARARDEGDAVAQSGEPTTRYLAGGTTLIDLMRLGIERPERVVDLQSLSLKRIEAGTEVTRIGAQVTNAELARDAQIVARYPALARAVLSGASPQVRNMASVGGNLLQRTRCPYFREVDTKCNKKVAGSGCPALEGYNRSHAVLGIADACIATHASDMCVALVALDATVHIRGKGGERSIPLAELYVLPAANPSIETVLAPGDLITHVELPVTPFFARSAYVKVRDRASFAFALASAAVAVDVEGGTIKAARVALGGVATRPWRSAEAEAALVGKPADRSTYLAAGAAAMRGAKGREHNAFKITLGERVVARALNIAAGSST